ncbi:MAG: pyrroline-5-carboxylate reductase [Oscillospiraceae bacterium]|nr:pyrroline-5-carboxylate reductase [Oscillospiraceae bacterium]
MDFRKIAFLGCGNMGSALARAAAKRTTNLMLTNRTPAKAEALAQELGVECGGNESAARSYDLLFLGVKPQIMGEVLQEIAPILRARAARQDRFILVSMAAGVPIARIRALAEGDFPVIRIMPNTPAAIGEGMILTCAEGVTDEELKSFTEVMGAAGRFDFLPEALIDAGSAVSGCGPAFVYPFIEALADGAVACGLPRDKAQLYAAQTLVGAARLVLESGQHPGALKDAVCSPGGSTIQGVRALEKGGFRSCVQEAVIAAYERTKELGK